MVCRNKSVNALVVNFEGSERKWANLENLSSTTHMTVLLPEGGRSVIKSLKISFQTCVGMGRG